MASAQADGSGVAIASQKWSRKIFSFADALLTHASNIWSTLPEQRTFALPASVISCGFSDPELAAVCDRALAFPEVRPAADDTRIAVLDLKSCPDLPAWTGSPPGMGNVTSPLAEHGICAVIDPDYMCWHIFDPARHLGVLALTSTDCRPPWDNSFPLRLLLNWAGRTAHCGFLHAGTLGLDGTGIFLAGAGGSGKSGTTLSGILHGLQSAGDDYVAVKLGHGSVQATPVLRRMKQDAAGLARLDIDVSRRGGDGVNWQGKYEFDFDQLVTGSRARNLEMSAILLPHITGNTSSKVRPASAREAMMSLAPSTLYQLHGSWKNDFSLVAAVARALPAFHCDLSNRPEEIAAAITQFISRRSP